MLRTSVLCGLLLALAIHESKSQSSFGTALRLYGDTAWVDVGDHDHLDFGAGEDFTIEAWFKTSSNGNQRILYKASLQTVSGYGIFVDQGGVRGAVFSPEIGGSILVPSPLGYDDGEFHHVAFVRDGGSLRVIVDGQTQETRDVPSGSLTNPGSLTIGADAINGGRFFYDGLIDEVRIWSVARSEEDIRATMSDTLGPEVYSNAGNGLVSYFRFDRLEDLGIGSEGANDFRDLSVFGSHGDLVGRGDIMETLADDFSMPRLTLQFRGMSPHVGQEFSVRVVDRGTGLEVARNRIRQIESPDFDVWMDALLTGNAYDIDFYADHNGNGLYDAPSLDHAWRLTLDPAMGNDTLTFAHNTSFIDIGWSPFLDFLQYEAIWKGITRYSGSETLSEVLARINVDLLNRTIDISVINESSVVFDTLSLFLSGTVTADGDSASVEPSEAPSGKNGLSVSWSGLSYALTNQALNGNVTFTNSGRAEGQLTFDALGMDVDFEIDGTLGRNQAVLNMKSDFMDIDATVLLKEDSVVSKTATSIQPDIPTAAGRPTTSVYPNPFNVSTTLSVVQSEPGRLEVVLYDILGRRIETIDDSHRLAGNHLVAVDGSHLSPGTYPYRVLLHTRRGETVTSSGTRTVAR